MWPAMNASSVDSCVSESTSNFNPKNKSTANAAAASQRKSGEFNFRRVAPSFFFGGTGCGTADGCGSGGAGEFCGRGSDVGESPFIEINSVRKKFYFRPCDPWRSTYKSKGSPAA